MTLDETIMQAIKIAIGVVFVVLFLRWASQVIVLLTIIANK